MCFPHLSHSLLTLQFKPLTGFSPPCPNLGIWWIGNRGFLRYTSGNFALCSLLLSCAYVAVGLFWLGVLMVWIFFVWCFSLWIWWIFFFIFCSFLEYPSGDFLYFCCFVTKYWVFGLLRFAGLFGLSEFLPAVCEICGRSAVYCEIATW